MMKKGVVTGFGPPIDIINFKSLVGVKPGDSSVVIQHQVDSFTSTWLAEHQLLIHRLIPDSQTRCQL